MKYSLTLGVILFVVWLLWSGHFDDPFLIGLGVLSCIFCVWLSKRMSIVDEEGAPVEFGLRPFTTYAPWLIKEIIVANIAVTKIICARKMPLQRNLIEVSANQKSSLGRVILANSITLTPGTISVNLQGDKILVHALSFAGAEEDLSGEMDRRVCRLEKPE
jgi:multicomponent Na+:H+ antiporter subunit E